MRKLLCLVLCLFMLTATAAQAAGDRVLARGGGSDGIADEGVQAVCTLGDEIWMLGWSKVYVYDAQTGEAAQYSWSADVQQAMKVVEDEDGWTRAELQGWFAWDGAVWTLLVNTRSGDAEEAQLFQVALEDGKAALRQATRVDWKQLLDGDWVHPEYSAAAGGVWCAAYWFGNGYTLALVPLDGSDGQQIEMKHEEYTGLCADGEAAYAFSRDSSGDCTYVECISLPDGDVEEIAVISGSEKVSCPVAEGDTGCFLLVQNGRLLRWSPESGETEAVAAMPVEVESAQGGLTTSGLYAAGSYSGVAVLDTLNRPEVQGTVVVSYPEDEPAVNLAIMDFVELHPEISVVRTAEESDLLSQLLTRSDAKDVYVLNTRLSGNEEYAQLIQTLSDRSWLTPMKSEALQSYVQATYPAVAQLCTSEEGVLMVPLNVDADGMTVNERALAQLGYTLSDVPKNWPDFLDFLGTLATDECTVPLCFDWYDEESAYCSLANAILTTYSLEIDSGASTGYDTEELRAAFAALDRLDCAKLAEISVEQGENWDDNALIICSDLCSIGASTYTEDYEMHPHLLSISADRPIRMALSGSVAFVNPASNNPEAAEKFLEAAVARVNRDSLAMLCPDRNETLRPANYEERSEDWKQRVEAAEKRLETAGEQDRQAISEELEELKSDQQQYEENAWSISPQSLEWYRANDDDVRFALGGGVDSSVYSSILEKVVASNPAGSRAAALIAELERQVEMSRQEG